MSEPNNNDPRDNNAVEDQIVNALSRRDIKRSRGRWRLGFVILAIFAVLYIIGISVNDEDKQDEDHIARIEVNGVILHDRLRLKVLQKLASDESVKAVIIAIDSPGGSTVGGEELYEAFAAIRAQKPVVATLNTLAASAGYMTAISADRIISRRTTITASIGVLYQHVDASELMKKIGIDLDKIATGPLKAEPDMDEPISPLVRASLQSMIDDSYDWFVDIVAQRRGLTLAKVRFLADGRIITGRQALALGLVDEIGGEIDAISWLEKERDIAADLPVLTHYPLPETDYPDLVRRLLSKSLSKTLNLHYNSNVGLTSALSLDG